MKLFQNRQVIERLVEEVNGLLPDIIERDLAQLNEFSDIPGWHSYEARIWEIGEKIRETLITEKLLRKDIELLDKYLPICLERRLKRGRQSFITLFGFKHCQPYAASLSSQIDDSHVNGHIIHTFNKMKVAGFGKMILPFTESEKAWIRNEAKKYMAKYA